MPPGNRTTRSASPTYVGPRPFLSREPTSTELRKLGHIRRKSITSIDDLPQRYVTAIKIIRMLKYSSACKKFQQAKKPVDLKDVVKESTQMNNRLSTILSDIQRRLDMALGTSKPASYLSDEQKRQQSLSARIEQIEHVTNDFEHKLDYLEHLALTLVENRWNKESILRRISEQCEGECRCWRRVCPMIEHSPVESLQTGLASQWWPVPAVACLLR